MTRLGRSDWLTHPRAARAAREICEGLAAADEQRIRAGVLGLAGLGEGSTPAGDDFLVGALHALWRCRPGPVAVRLAAGAAEAAIPRTTSASGHWLAAAARGEASAPWRRLLEALDRGAGPDLAAATAAVLALGHTSGAASLAGFARARAAFAASAAGPR
jgi:hypothetical protein